MPILIFVTTYNWKENLDHWKKGHAVILICINYGVWEYFLAMIRNKGKVGFTKVYSCTSEEITPWESFMVRGCVDTSLHHAANSEENAYTKKHRPWSIHEDHTSSSVQNILTGNIALGPAHVKILRWEITWCPFLFFSESRGHWRKTAKRQA